MEEEEIRGSVTLGGRRNLIKERVGCLSVLVWRDYGGKSLNLKGLK